MSAISFTGKSGKLSKDEKKIVAEHIGAIKGTPRIFRNGCATGVDIYAAECAVRSFPDSKHLFMIPTWAPSASAPPQPCKRDRDGMSRLNKLAVELGVWCKWEWCSPGVGSEAKGLLRRDDILAVNCSHLLAFPRTDREEKRSGTWATIRRARKLGRGIKVVPLDGSEPWTESSVPAVTDKIAAKLGL